MGFLFFLLENVSLYLAIISLDGSARLSAMTGGKKEKKNHPQTLHFLIYLKFEVCHTQVGRGECEGSLQAVLPQRIPQPAKKKLRATGIKWGWLLRGHPVTPHSLSSHIHWNYNERGVSIVVSLPRQPFCSGLPLHTSWRLKQSTSVDFPSDPLIEFV